MEFIQAELNDPDYKDPSVLSYTLHGWLNVYKASALELNYLNTVRIISVNMTASRLCWLPTHRRT